MLIGSVIALGALVLSIIIQSSEAPPEHLIIIKDITEVIAVIIEIVAFIIEIDGLSGVTRAAAK